MENNITILIVDDHQVVREGLGRLLAKEDDLEIVGQGSNSEEALLQVEMFSPNIVLMDIKMPGMDGIELTKLVKQKRPYSKVIMLTLYDEYLMQAMEAGASGYLLKDIKQEALAQAIKDVNKGETIISDSVTAKQRNDYEEKYGVSTNGNSSNIFEELQMVIPPPIEANQLIGFAKQVEEVLKSHVMQVVGSWNEGTTITIMLNTAMALEDILEKIGLVSGIDTVAEEPSSLNDKFNYNLLRKAKSIPRLNNRPRKTIFVTLEKELSEVAS
ncbi:response regulator transcription factor [Chloroflexota bacterium]